MRSRDEVISIKRGNWEDLLASVRSLEEAVSGLCEQTDIELLTTKQLSNELGFCSEIIRDLVDTGYLPVVKVRKGCFRFRRSSVAKALKNMEEGGLM